MTWAGLHARRWAGRPMMLALATLIAVLGFAMAAWAAPVRGLGSAPVKSPRPFATGAKAKKTTKPKRKVNPCMTPDPGWGIYDKWDRGVSVGQMLAPQRGGLTRGGGFDLIVHFHGHYPIRKEYVKTAEGTVMVAIDLGVGSGAYYQAFAAPAAFEKLLDSVKETMKRRSGRKKVYIRKLALSSWSAGYGAVAQILQQPAGKDVDALILLDSVHAGYANAAKKTLKTEQLTPFLEFARKASRGKGFMFQSHSSIIPPGYASTQEVSHYLVGELGGKMRKSKRDDVLGLEMFERYDRGNYHVRGYRGDDKPDHCAHLGLMKDVMRVHINRRWRSPKGFKGKASLAKERKEAAKDGRVYAVRRGDTLSGIASKHGVSTAALRKENGLKKGKPIRVGQRLIIPEEGSGAADDDDDDDDGKVHRVRRGDTLTGIARKYGVTVSDLRSANRLRKGQPIRVGQKLKVPEGSKAKRGSGKRKDKKGKKSPKPGPGEKLHKVYKGQSLGAISRRYHVTVDAIRERNDIKKGGRPIQPGDELIIPKPEK